MYKKSRWWVGVCGGLLLGGCGEVAETPAGPLRDDGGAYTVSAREDFTLPASTLEGAGLSTQALGTPTLKLELRNYSAASTGARSRGVVSVTWPSGDAPLGGTARLGLETVDGTLVASHGLTVVEGAATLTTPYIHQPSERLCVTLDAELWAETLSGDSVELSLEQRVCEETALASQQDVLLASQSVERLGVQTTTELRYLEGVGYRALVRYRAPDDASISGKLCLHEEGKATCKRSASTLASFDGGGVAEFATSYYAAPAGLPLCASVLGVGACASGSVELLKAHSYDGGVNTNVVLLGTLEGVVGRATFSVPEGVSLHAYAYLEFVHGGDYESFFSLYNGAGVSKGVPGVTGPATQTVELGPLSPGAQVCYSLGVPYSREGEYPELVEMSGCADPAAN